MIECGCCGAQIDSHGWATTDHPCSAAGVQRVAREVEARMPAFILIVGRRPWLAETVMRMFEERERGVS